METYTLFTEEVRLAEIINHMQPPDLSWAFADDDMKAVPLDHNSY